MHPPVSYGASTHYQWYSPSTIHPCANSDTSDILQKHPARGPPKGASNRLMGPNTPVRGPNAQHYHAALSTRLTEQLPPLQSSHPSLGYCLLTMLLSQCCMGCQILTESTQQVESRPYACPRMISQQLPSQQIAGHSNLGTHIKASSHNHYRGHQP